MQTAQLHAMLSKACLMNIVIFLRPQTFHSDMQSIARQSYIVGVAAHATTYKQLTS